MKYTIGSAPQPAQQPVLLAGVAWANKKAIQDCIDRLIHGGKPAEAAMLRHHFGIGVHE